MKPMQSMPCTHWDFYLLQMAHSVCAAWLMGELSAWGPTKPFVVFRDELSRKSGLPLSPVMLIFKTNSLKWTTDPSLFHAIFRVYHHNKEHLHFYTHQVSITSMSRLIFWKFQMVVIILPSSLIQMNASCCLVQIWQPFVLFMKFKL